MAYQLSVERYQEIITTSEEFIDSKMEPLRRVYLKTCCKPACRVKWVKNKGAILIIIWSYLVVSVFHLLRAGNDDNPDKITSNGMILVAATLLFPIGGWLADTHFGRYNVVRYSMWIMWTGIILATMNELSGRGSTLYKNHIRDPVIYFLTVIVAVGFGGFQSNIVQLGIDQLTDASTVEIRSFITWYTPVSYTHLTLPTIYSV